MVQARDCLLVSRMGIVFTFNSQYRNDFCEAIFRYKIDLICVVEVLRQEID